MRFLRRSWLRLVAAKQHAEAGPRLYLWGLAAALLVIRSDLSPLAILEGDLSALSVSSSSPLFVLGFNLASEVSFGKLEELSALPGRLERFVEFFLLLGVLTGDDDVPLGAITLHGVSADDAYDLLLLLVKLVKEFGVLAVSLAVLARLVAVAAGAVLTGSVAQCSWLLGQQCVP